MRIYSRLSLKPMVIGHRGNQISCWGREMFVGLNLVLAVGAGGEGGVEKLFGETQKCHRVGFHRVCYKGVYNPNHIILV